MQRIRSLGRARRAILAAGVVWLACFAALESRGETPPSVILISLDGMRPADVTAPDLPAFAALLRRGAHASRMIPVFPSNTFPNHVSLVTGVAPDVHGIVNNEFVDPERGAFDKSNDPSWLLAEPLWSIAAQHGVASASYFWVGSEGPWHGRGPLHWKPFDGDLGEQEKVEQILAWLGGPEPRPRLITAWFRGVDRPSHVKGMGSPAVRRLLEKQDEALAKLVAGLDARGAFAHTTLLLVSDHGMAPVKRHIDLRAALRAGRVKGEVIGGGGMATLKLPDEPGIIDRAVTIAKGLGLDAWPREETPLELRARHPRFGEVVVVAPVGVAIQIRSGPLLRLRGSHGYWPQDPSMGALFLAVGRGVPAGADLGELSTLDVAPTVLRLLGLPASDTMEGRAITRLLPESKTAVPEPPAEAR
jgi:predicted AlkP superfamily pyrophosphatase or phosphodiesterase